MFDITDSMSRVFVLNLGGRSYVFVPFVNRAEVSVGSDEMIRRAYALGAILNDEEVSWIFDHMEKIPNKVAERLIMVKTRAGYPNARPMIVDRDGLDRSLPHCLWDSEDHLVMRLP